VNRANAQPLDAHLQESTPLSSSLLDFTIVPEYEDTWSEFQTDEDYSRHAFKPSNNTTTNTNTNTNDNNNNNNNNNNVINNSLSIIATNKSENVPSHTNAPKLSFKSETVPKESNNQILLNNRMNNTPPPPPLLFSSRPKSREIISGIGRRVSQDNTKEDTSKVNEQLNSNTEKAITQKTNSSTFESTNLSLTTQQNFL
jgi:hypothetical protein